MVVRVGLCMLQGARHAHIQSLQHASEQSGIEILIHELRTESQFRNITVMFSYYLVVNQQP